MLKNKCVIEAKVGDRTYSLEVYNDSPLGEAYDAITQIRAYIIDRINIENQNSKPKSEDK